MPDLAETLGLKLAHAAPGLATGAAPWLTITVFAYNHEAFVDECLASIHAGADLAGVELIFVDDGSRDGTLARCTAFSFNPALRVRAYTKPNQGHVHSLACALALAEGEYLIGVSGDDLYEPGALSQLRALLTGPGLQADAVLCQARYRGAADDRLVYPPAVMAQFFSITAEARLEHICTEFPQPMLLQSTVFRTAFLQGIAPFRDRLELDDWPTFIRVFTAEAEGRAVVRWRPELVLGQYRIHDRGMHHQLDRILRITEQVARSVVPERFSRHCLANTRIDLGLRHLYLLHVPQGLMLCARGLLTWPRWAVVSRLARRLRAALMRRLQGQPG